MKTSFDPIKHEYSVDGVIYPSVTQILQSLRFIDYSMVRKGVLDITAERGQTVHKIIELYELGELDEATIDPALRGYFDSYLALNIPRPLEIELPLFNRDWLYAGTPDQLYEDGINDIKTGQKNIAHGLQLTAYWMTWRPNKVPKFLNCLYLNADGKPGDVVGYEYIPAAWIKVMECMQVKIDLGVKI